VIPLLLPWNLDVSEIASDQIQIQPGHWALIDENPLCCESALQSPSREFHHHVSFQLAWVRWFPLSVEQTAGRTTPTLYRKTRHWMPAATDNPANMT
jgi:hypothetical protein